MAIVTLNDIHVAFGSEVVLDKLDLSLHPNEKIGMWPCALNSRLLYICKRFCPLDPYVRGIAPHTSHLEVASLP
jgi:hypothetical protein